MNLQRWLWVALLALPIVVAVFDFGLLSTVFLVLIWLAARWVATLRGLTKPEITGLHLDTIAASHFVEKVRWCLDRAGIPYTEHQSVGSMGAFFTGRSVPRLRAHTGLVTTSIGNSPEILRYLWGNYAHEDPERRAFLEPTPERIAMEQKLELYGRNLQIWVYYHMLQHPDKLSRVWGVYDTNTPPMQRLAARVIAPLLRRLIRLSFNINSKSVDSARFYIEKLLSETEGRLAESPYLVGEERSYVDYTFAALTGLWLQPEQFGNGAADNVRLAPDDYPQTVNDEVTRWRDRFPLAVSFVENLYQNERSDASQDFG